MQEGTEAVGVDRGREQVALGEVAVEAAEHVQLVFVLDALGRRRGGGAGPGPGGGGGAAAAAERGGNEERPVTNDWSIFRRRGQGGLR